MQHFSIEIVKQWLTRSTPIATLDAFNVNYVDYNNDRCVILTDDNQIAAFASFLVRLNGTVWQSKNVATYNPYKGQQLSGKLYKLVKEHFKKSIQSDIEQSSDGEKLWTKILPSLGFSPMIFDTKTEHIIDPTSDIGKIIDVYKSDEMRYDMRYTWILEKNDYYHDTDFLQEHSLIMPHNGKWYTFKND